MSILVFLMLLTMNIQAIQIKEVVKVYDGDTIYVNLDCVISIFCKNIGVRLQGIDTPEIKTRNRKEKEAGIKAREYLKSVIDKASYIELVNYERGKYFRIIGDVRVNGLSLSETMISAGHARYYDGGEKIKWK